MPSWHVQGQCTFSHSLLMVLEIMVVEIIEVHDVYWIYLAEVREQSVALVYMWKCVKFLSNVRAY